MTHIPELGLGTKHVSNNKCGIDFVKCAIDCGYRHIATSPSYNNEKEIGDGIRISNVNRHDIYITTQICINDKLCKETFIDKIISSIYSRSISKMNLLNITLKN